MNKSRLSTYIILLYFFLFTFITHAQNSNQAVLVSSTNANKELTFYEIQKEFYDYWDSKNVKHGYYTEDNVEKKAYGWKQFKRWEWFWNNRIDPTTGKFPNVSASDFYTERSSASQTKSSTGNWTSLGPTTTSGGYAGLGRLNCIGFRENDVNTFYVGAPSGGLWKTTDGGSNWNPLTDYNDVLGVSDVIVIAGVTTSSDIVYIGTGDRDGGSMWSLGGGQSNDNNSIGILKSIDGGDSWASTGLTFSTSQKETVNRLLLDTDDNNTLYAATSDGFYKTEDAGVNWTKLYSTEFVDIEFKPGNDLVIYGSTRNGKIYLSTDGGVNWSEELDLSGASCKRIDLAVSADEPTWVYAVVVNSTRGMYGVYKSTDSGDSYTIAYNTLNLLGNNCDGSGTEGQGSYDLAIATDPNNAQKVFIGGINTWYSSDGGNSWTSSNMWTSSSTYNSCGSPEVHADKHFFAYQNGSSTLFECNDGGLYKTSDDGITWTHLGSGLEISQLYRMDVSQTTSDDIIAGLQDNGTKSMRSGSWTDVIGGDGMDCIIDYTDEDIQYGEYQYGNLYRTTNKWGSKTDITTGLTGSADWVMPISIDPNINTTIYAGMQDVFKSTDRGDNWTQISSWNGTTLKEIAVAPSNSDYIYTTTQSVLYKTTDGGTNWSNITGTLPTGSSYITYISVKDDDPNTVWVSLGQYNGYGVYETTDGGTTWTNISSGLPSIPVMCVIQNTQNTTQTELYCGTDVGVYVKVGTSAWTLFSDGLPNVVVNELKIYYNSTTPNLSRLRAATSGRGVWESELYSAPDSPPASEFVADITTPEIGQTVTFSDLSSNAPTSWSWSFTPSTITYANGTNSTSQNPEVQFNSEESYTVQLTATNAFGSDAETKLNYISVSEMESYCTAEGGGDSYISGVQLETIDNQNTGNNGYADYTNISTNLTVNNSYNITITTRIEEYSLGYYYNSGSLGIWIDWNQDGDFDDAGENSSCNVGSSNYIQTYSISVPEDATLGNTTIRIRHLLSESVCGDPCGSTTLGEVEDYKVTILPETNNWVGTSSDWSTASNWSESIVPNASFDVTIPTSPSGGNFPTVSNGTNAACNSLTIESNASIALNGYLDINSNLTINSEATLNIGSTADIIVDNLSINSGIITLQSVSDGTGSLIVNDVLSENATINLQRYIAGHNNSAEHGWHFLSSPVSSQAIADFHTAGSGNDFYKWDEATYTWLNRTAEGNVLNNDFESDFEIGKGYLIANVADANLVFSGDINTSDITISGLSNNGDATKGGWNLIGNPFSSAITWNNGDWNLSNIDANSQIWEESSASYTVIDASQIIPSMNGFMVRANTNNASLTIPASARVHDNTSWYKHEKSELDRIVLNAIDLAGSTSQKTIVKFATDASEKYNPSYDSYFLQGYAPQFFSILDGYNFAQKALPLLSDTTSIQLGFIKNKYDTFEIALEENTTGQNIYLIDYKLEQIHLLNKNNYSFSSIDGDSPNRFKIQFTDIVNFAPEIEAQDVWYSDGLLYVSLIEEETVMEVLDISGRLLQSRTISGTGIQTVSIQMPIGIYLIRLTSSKGSIANKVIIN